MALKQQHKIIKNPKTLIISIVAILIFFIMLSSVFELWQKNKAIKKHIYELKNQKQELLDKKDKIDKLNETISTPEGQEKIFRDTYRLVKPGEGIIVITKENTIENTIENKPIIRRFWDSIKKGLGF